jgi:hypothetical protein
MSVSVAALINDFLLTFFFLLWIGHYTTRNQAFLETTSDMKPIHDFINPRATFNVQVALIISLICFLTLLTVDIISIVKQSKNNNKQQLGLQIPAVVISGAALIFALVVSGQATYTKSITLIPNVLNVSWHVVYLLGLIIAVSSILMHIFLVKGCST